MKFNDDITMSIASAAKDVLEGKVQKEEVKYPHMMYHPETGKEVEVKDKAEHEKYAEKGYTHDKPKVNEVEEPRAKGEKDFKDKHVVKKSGEKEDGTVMKEAKKEVKEDDVDDSEAKIEKEESDKQKKYQAFFAKALKKFGVKSPAELEGEKKKEFFDYVDANYEADNETDESVKEEVEQVDEILGFVKKVKDKITGKESEPTKTGAIARNSFSSPSYIKVQLKAANKKLKDAQDKLAKATKDNNEDGMDHWGEVELNRMNDIEKLKKRLKDAEAKS